jgi:hypothetical protein
MVRVAVEAAPPDGDNEDGENAHELSAGSAVQERLTAPL